MRISTGTTVAGPPTPTLTPDGAPHPAPSYYFVKNLAFISNKELLFPYEVPFVELVCFCTAVLGYLCVFTDLLLGMLG